MARFLMIVGQPRSESCLPGAGIMEGRLMHPFWQFVTDLGNSAMTLPSRCGRCRIFCSPTKAVPFASEL